MTVVNDMQNYSLSNICYKINKELIYLKEKTCICYSPINYMAHIHYSYNRWVPGITFEQQAHSQIGDHSFTRVVSLYAYLLKSVRPSARPFAPKTKQKCVTTLHGAWWITKFARLVVINFNIPISWFFCIFQKSCMFWFPAQAINFIFVPSSMRVVYIGTTSFLWVNILCILKREPVSDDQDPGQKEN